MKLKELLNVTNSDELPMSLLEREVKNIKIDLNKIEEGDVFLLLKDDEQAQFKMKEALKAGADFVLSSNDYGLDNCFAIRNPRRAFAIMEKKLHNCACDKMKLIGVTGTNGKTTTTNIIYNILKGAGKNVGIIGTLGYKTNGDWIDTGFTTPDPDIMHDVFLNMYNSGVEYVVMEVSAHALALEKMEGIKFDVGVLTNITQDHLDFFGNMENYTNAKYKFFDGRHCRKAVVCSDGVNMNKFMKMCEVPVVSYGMYSPADVFAIDVKQTFGGSNFVCNDCDEIAFITTPLVGEYNVQNTLAAISACSLIGMELKTIERQLRFLPQIDGRFDIIQHAGKKVVIDYAHTPDGMEKLISTVRSLTKGRVLTLFGCGGNRDAIKRPIMGKITTKLSDKCFFTSDNPRFEDPCAIISQIVQGAERDNYVIEPDRKKAIKMALDETGESDVLIIAGKGAEKYQDICGQKQPYDDYSQVLSYEQEHSLVTAEEAEVDFKR